MTTPAAPTKSELVANLESSRDEFLSMLRPIAADEFEQGRYESGWNGREILAHVAAIEWTYPRLLEVARQAQGASAGEQSASLPTRAAQGGIDEYNRRQVEKRAGVPVAELLSEFERNRAQTIAAVSGADEALLAVPIRSAGGVSGPLGNVFQGVAVRHILQHARDIMRIPGQV